MKYFFDTEFLEGTQKRSLMLKSRLGSWMIGRPKPTIDLISIGIVSEHDKEYYAISKDFNLKEAWNRYDLKINKHYPMGPENLKSYWIRDNVLKPIWYSLEFYELNSVVFNENMSCFIPEENVDHISYQVVPKPKDFTYRRFKYLINKYGKTNNEIAKEIIEFCDPTPIEKRIYTNPEFYAYYADYDWVVFCWLFGKMIDLPAGFPMYCKDLKQILDEKDLELRNDKSFMKKIRSSSGEYKGIKNLLGYPTQENEHSALSDAIWNKRLYKFIESL